MQTVITQGEEQRTLGEVALGPATLLVALLALAGVGLSTRSFVEDDGADTFQLWLLIGGAILGMAAIWMGTASLVRKNRRARLASWGIRCAMLALFAPTLAALFLLVGPIAFAAAFACAAVPYGAIELILRLRSRPSAADGTRSWAGVASCWIASISSMVWTFGLVAPETTRFWVMLFCQLAAVLAIRMGERDLLHGKHPTQHAIVGTTLAALTLCLSTLLFSGAILSDD